MITSFIIHYSRGKSQQVSGLFGREAGFTSRWIGFINTVYRPPHECKGTLRTRGAVCVYVFGLQMEIVLLATMSSTRTRSNGPNGRRDHGVTSAFKHTFSTVRSSSLFLCRSRWEYSISRRSPRKWERVSASKPPAIFRTISCGNSIPHWPVVFSARQHSPCDRAGLFAIATTTTFLELSRRVLR
jgi:hypothetical protein